MSYISSFLNIEPAVQIGDKLQLVLVYTFFLNTCVGFDFLIFFFEKFTSTFMSDIGLWFSFPVMCLSGFGIRVVLASQGESGGAPRLPPSETACRELAKFLP